MSRDLQKLPWQDDYVRAVQQFYFGDRYWELEIEHWIKHEVTEVIAQGRAVVWLYATEDDGLVGFGSLGATRWRWPLPTDSRVPINIIPAVGIDKRFWGEPSGEGERRFSDQILDHLIYEAHQHQDRRPALGLFVHTENRRAIRVYERAGFTQFSQPFTNEDGEEYISMVLDL